MAFFALNAANAQSVASPTPPSVRQLFTSPKFGHAQLSPDGNYLAVTANKDGYMNLAVVDLTTNQSKVIAGYTGNDVGGFMWLTSDRLLYTFVNRTGKWLSDQSGLFAVDRDGENGRILTQNKQLSVYRKVTSEPDVVVAVERRYNGDLMAHQINTKNGRWKEIEITAPGRPFQFAFDHHGALRAVVAAESWTGKQMTVYTRDTADGSWQAGLQFDGAPGVVQLAGYSGDNKTLYVTAPGPKGKSALFELAPGGAALGKMLASDDAVDIDPQSLIFDPASKELLGVGIASEPSRTEWLKPEWQRLQVSVDKALAGTANWITPGGAAGGHLILSHASTRPGQYWIYKTADRKLQPLITRRPDLSPESLSVQQVFDYAARDKTPIMSYLTLPRGQEPKALPLAVLVHGGPWARDHWGFDPQVQFLAGLGYAVLQPQFRGSSGFGVEFLKKSRSGFGTTMQDDLANGVNALVAQGVADAKRVCYVGASYGGYAAMMAAVRGETRCAVNLLGPTDLDLLFTTGDMPEVPAALHYITQMVGEPAQNTAAFAAASPARQASKINVPVLMVYGAKDQRVPLDHAKSMRNAMDRAGKPYEYIELADEGHGFGIEANRIKVYEAIGKFLRVHNPP